MSLRPKTKRRLMVIVGVAALIVGATSWFVSMRLGRFEAERQRTRAAAMLAYRHGDYALALVNFRRYLNGIDNVADAPPTASDPAAVYAYAVCRARTPSGLDRSYLVEAKSIFSRFLELEPGDGPAEHELLSIYRQLGYDAEAAQLADVMLQQSPNDIAALRAKARELAHQGKFGEALQLSQRACAQEPADLASQQFTLNLMAAAHLPAAEITDHAAALLAAHPNDCRFLLLRGLAAGLVGDRVGAAEFLRQSSAAMGPGRAAVTPQFVAALVEAFDRLGLYSDAEDALQRAAAANPKSTTIQAALWRREWEQHGPDAVLRHPQPPALAMRSSLLGTRALAWYSRGKPGDAARADAALVLLGRRADDPLAAGWRDLLRCRWGRPVVSRRAALELCRSANSRLAGDRQGGDALGSGEEISCCFLGSAEQAVGETELAAQAWRGSAALQPAWAEPRRLLAEALLAQGQVAAAVAEANAALALAPSDRAVQITAIQVSDAALRRGEGGIDLQRLLQQAEHLQQSAPGSVEPESLPVYVDLLARRGEVAQAEHAAGAGLGQRARLNCGQLAQLTQVASEHHLAVAGLLADRLAEASAGCGSDLLQQARALEQIGRRAQAQRCVKTATAAHADEPQWELAALQWRSAHGDDDAGAWAKLSAAAAGDAAVQRAALQSPAVWHNRLLAAQCIDRLRQCTGDEGIDWRLAMARWQLSSPQQVRDNASAAATAMAEVVRVAPRLPQPLVLWADALQKLGDVTGAIDRLRTAAALSPDDAAISSRLAELLREQGQDAQPAEARVQAGSPQAGSPQAAQSALGAAVDGADALSR